MNPEPFAAARPPGPLRRWIAALAATSARHPLVVVALALVATVVAFTYVARHIAIDTDSSKLISSKLPWRERSAAFDAAFPHRSDLIAIVVDGSTPEIAERAAAALTERLAKDTALFRNVRRPDGGPFFAKNGLLFLSIDEVTRTTEQLVEAQPLLGTLAADPSVRGLMTALGLAVEGVRRGEATLERLAPALRALDATLASVIAGRTEPLSWRSMLGGRAPDARELRRFVLVQPNLDFTALKPGAKATDAIRQVARAYATDEGLAAGALRVRLTGNVPMADEEFGTLEENAVLNTSAMLVALIAMLWLAVRSIRATVASVACLVVGLALTAAFGLAVFGVFNLISVAFAVLFVGLGVDFSIQYAVAYRSQFEASAAARFDSATAPSVAGRAALAVGASLALAAVAIAMGFFSFEPTDYRGVSELGVIAGFGMVIAFFASLTLLPAALVLMRVGPSKAGMGFDATSPVGRASRWLEARRRPVLVVAGVAALASAATLPWLRFDFDPLHLRSPETEAVATILDLSRDPMTTPNTIDVLVPSVDASKAMAAKLAALPEVEHALNVTSFVPEDQQAKLAIIGDAAMLLGPTLDPGVAMTAPTDAESAAALRKAASDLDDVAKPDTSDAARVAQRVAQKLASVARGPIELRRALDRALVPGLETTISQARDALQAAPVTLASLPPELVRDWVAPDGRARIEVYPKAVATGAASGDDRALARFIAAVRRVAPDATGAPISIAESARTIVHAFVVAGLLAMVLVTALLVVVLGRARDVLTTLASLTLGGLVTLGFCVAFGIALNFENVIALPLLFGIGVAFNIYFVVAWRRGTRHLLETSLARAVVFSALTTATAFGSLWLSSHPGTASMGKLLALSLACTLAAALVVLPALLGPPPVPDRVPRAT